MLVGSGVEHQLRPVLGHDIVQTAHVPHGADEHLQIQLRMGVAQLHLDIVGVVLINIEDDQLFGVAFGDLAAQLAADGTAAAGDHHHLAGDIPADLLQIHLNRVTAQQILQLHVPKLADTDLAADQLEHPRHRLHPAAGLAADVQNLLAVLSVAGGDGENDLIDLVLLHRIGDLLPPAGDLYTVQIPAALAGVVVDDAHHPAAQPGIGIDLPDQLASGLTGTDHQNAVPLAFLRADPRHQLAHESVGEPQCRGGHEAHDKARKVEGAGHIDLQDQHIGQSGCQQHAIGQNDAEQLVDADKAPDAVIQPEQLEHHQTDDDPRPDDLQILVEVHLRDGPQTELKPHPQRQEKGPGDAQHIQHEDHHRPPQSGGHGSFAVFLFHPFFLPAAPADAGPPVLPQIFSTFREKSAL